MDIICSKCYKHLFKHSDDNIFGAIHYALHNGFIYKNAVLFTGVDTKLFFCSKECKDSYYEANIPKNEEVSQALGKLRKDYIFSVGVVTIATNSDLVIKTGV